MRAILFASNHEVLASHTHDFAAILVALHIAFESPLSGMRTNPARTFVPALSASYWHALWIYFIGPPVGMLAAAEVLLLARERKDPYCAKLHHHNDKRCTFLHSGPAPTAPANATEGKHDKRPELTVEKNPHFHFEHHLRIFGCSSASVFSMVRRIDALAVASG
jgi:aquaporin Z